MSGRFLGGCHLEVVDTQLSVRAHHIKGRRIHLCAVRSETRGFERRAPR